jgi:DNA-binding sugar fermentation-stimulating protein
MECLTFSNKSDLICLKILKRPSGTIKSPYVADSVILSDDSEKSIIEDDCMDDSKTKYLLHTPGLGCGGLVIPDKYVYGIKSSVKSKTHFTAMMSYNEDSEGIYYVGVHPMISQKACLPYLQHKFSDFVWETEVTLTKETRIDYVGTHKTNHKKFYVEVKNAMVSYEEKKVRAERRAIFPESSKRTLVPVSERALKHANTLKDLLTKEDTYKAMLLYTVPRCDCMSGVVINPNDVSYSNAVRDASEAGVILQGIGFKFDLTGIVKMTKELNVYFE